jgi:hypothetical protein
MSDDETPTADPSDAPSDAPEEQPVAEGAVATIEEPVTPEDLDGQRQCDAPRDLISKANSTADRGQAVIDVHVAPQQPALDCSQSVPREPMCDGGEQIVLPLKRC